MKLVKKICRFFGIKYWGMMLGAGAACISLSLISWFRNSFPARAAFLAGILIIWISVVKIK